MNKVDTRQLKQSVSVLSLFENDGHKIKRIGGQSFVCCPFHGERTPSCAVHDTHFICFGCGEKGDAFTYVMKRNGCSFKEAVEILSGSRMRFTPSKPLVMVPKQEIVPNDDLSWKHEEWKEKTKDANLKRFADTLGVTMDGLVRLEIAWAEDHKAWAIPMRIADRSIVGIRLRDENGRKWAVKGSKNGLFIPSGKGRDLVVTEGPTDCAAALSMGLFAIGLPMAGFGFDEIKKFIRDNRVARVIIIPDNDEKPGCKNTGMASAQKLIDSLRVPACEVVLPTKDFREFSRLGGCRALFDSMLTTQRWVHHTRP